MLIKIDSQTIIMKTAFLAVLLLATVFLSGCVQEPQAPTIPQPPGSELGDYTPPLGTPSLEIIYPKNGDVIGLSAVGIRVNVTNFKLKNIAANQVNKPNEGHINYYLDEKEQRTSLTTVSFAGVPPGEHILRIELVNNDNSPLVPSVSATVVFGTTG